MNHIKSACYLCDGPIEFPIHGVGQHVTCPHCQGSITLECKPSIFSQREPFGEFCRWLVGVASLVAIVWISLDVFNVLALPPYKLAKELTDMDHSVLELLAGGLVGILIFGSLLLWSIGPGGRARCFRSFNEGDD